MSKTLTVYLPGVLFLIVVIGMTLFDAPVEMARELLAGHGTEAYIAFFLAMAGAIVFMPVTTLPLIPIAAVTIGPLPTALLSIAGWTVGSMIAFLLARHLGRPILERFVSLDEADAFIETVPPNTRFFSIILLRLTVPVDFVSYGLGLVNGIRFWEFSVATLIGVSWFAFVFAYIGEAFFTGNTFLILELALFSLLIFTVGWYMLRRTRNQKRKK